MRLLEIRVALPAWVPSFVPWTRAHETDADRMRLAVALAGENVGRRTGGPFGAAVFDLATGLPVAVGVNLVEPARNAILHAEIVALMLAERLLERYSLGDPDLPPHALATSCEPCAMCLGAAVWSGVRRLVCGATREDARRIGFDEGPVFSESYRYLQSRGVTVVREVLRPEAAAVLERYRREGGTIYNG
jgi:tRNA(Arg) A34 adenosine deaminase TadA